MSTIKLQHIPLRKQPPTLRPHGNGIKSHQQPIKSNKLPDVTNKNMYSLKSYGKRDYDIFHSCLIVHMSIQLISLSVFRYTCVTIQQQTSVDIH